MYDLHDFHYSTCEAKLIKALQVNAKNAPQDRGAPLHALFIVQTTGLTYEIHQPLVFVLICANHIFVHNRIWIAIVLQCFTHLFPRFTSFASSMPATFSNFTPVSGSILMASSMQPLPECIKCVTRCCTTPLSIQSHYIPLPWFDMICLRLHNSSHWLPRSSKIFKNLPRPWTTTAKRCQASWSVPCLGFPVRECHQHQHRHPGSARRASLARLTIKFNKGQFIVSTSLP